MAIKLINGYQVETSAVFKNGDTLINHSLEVYITDADASITALTVQLQTRCNPDGAFFVQKEHSFTGAQLTALKAKIDVTGAPAKEIKVAISTITGATNADNVDVWYHGAA
jgi:hypothetical protein